MRHAYFTLDEPKKTALHMAYCGIHGNYAGDGCPDCKSAEEKASTDRAEMIETIEAIRDATGAATESIAYEINNPGNYRCPYCQLRSLLLNASRCPKCHGAIDESFWPPIRQQVEKQMRTVAEEQQKRHEENRRRSLEEERRAADNLIQSKRRGRLQLCFFLLPVCWYASVLVVVDSITGGFSIKDSFFLIYMAIPLLNWVFMIGCAVAAPRNGAILWALVLLWQVIGAFFCFGAKLKMRKD